MKFAYSSGFSSMNFTRLWILHFLCYHFYLTKIKHICKCCISHRQDLLFYFLSHCHSPSCTGPRHRQFQVRNRSPKKHELYQCHPPQLLFLYHLVLICCIHLPFLQGSTLVPAGYSAFNLSTTCFGAPNISIILSMRYLRTAY